MKWFKTMLAISLMMVPVAALAADDKAAADAQPTTAAPPKDAKPYACWDMMKNGTMMHMGGMMNGMMQSPPDGAKVGTCWDMMQNGKMMHMMNMNMMWNQPQSTPAPAEKK